jgi:2-polyprenyl-3-methyl-5-hydroxy-6-metoxy-1,4-benzoquinol methylase
MNFPKDSRLIQNPLGFWEICPKPSSETLRDHYAEKYYQNSKGQYAAEYSREEIDYFLAKLSQRWNVVQKLLGSDKDGYLLDVGCGEGFALAYFLSLGWRVKGIDYSAHGIRTHNPDCQSYLLTGDIFQSLEEEIAGNRQYELVWLQNVLEHVIEPIDLLKSLRQLVTPNGLLVVTVPNDFSILQEKAINENHIDEMFWVRPPEHLSYFNYESLLNTVQSTGWICREVLSDFPIDWFLLHSKANYVNDSSVGKEAHKVRIKIENLIHSQSIEEANIMYSALAKLGLGRSLTVFLQVNN